MTRSSHWILQLPSPNWDWDTDWDIQGWFLLSQVMEFSKVLSFTEENVIFGSFSCKMTVFISCDIMSSLLQTQTNTVWWANVFLKKAGNEVTSDQYKTICLSMRLQTWQRFKHPATCGKPLGSDTFPRKRLPLCCWLGGLYFVAVCFCFFPQIK